MDRNQLNHLLNDRLKRLKVWLPENSERPEELESINKMLYDTFRELIADNYNRFDELTQKIEAEHKQEGFVITTAVCSKEDIGKQRFFYPVCVEAPNDSDYLSTVFMKCDFHTIKECINRTHTAKITTETGTMKINVSLKYSERYLQKIETLYDIFAINEQPWVTLNGVYLYKFLDVYSTKAINEKIVDLEIDFAHNNANVLYDKELMWNIEEITVPAKSVEMPADCLIQQEHIIKNLQPDEYRYLLFPFGDRFTCFWRDDLMYVRTHSKKLTQFKLLRISNVENADDELFLPPKSNQKAFSAEGLAKWQQRFVPTKGEAERIVNSLQKETGLILADVKLLPQTEFNGYDRIDFNSFIYADAFLTNRKVLLFSFKKGEIERNIPEYFSHELMFFLLSELQLYFYEFQCIGELV